MSQKNIAFLILSLTFLSACNTLGVEAIRPQPGMPYAEFAKLSIQSLQGRPTAITSQNKTMIYTLPYQSEIYYWFEDGHFTKMTRRLPDLRQSWEAPVALPDP